MSRLKARAEQNRKKAQQEQQAGFWPELCRRIEAGQVIPIVSNGFFNEQLFFINEEDNNPEDVETVGWSIEDKLADAWADEISFPLAEQHWLPRVALFDRVVNSSDDRESKTRYLNWLKGTFLFLAEDDEGVDEDQIAELQEEIEQNSFGDLVRELNYPRPANGKKDGLELLAKLKLPIYITTSHFDFLERAIEANGRKPHTQICFWSKEPTSYTDPSHRTDYDFKPTVENPLVYHVFGLEDYPESMVLHEDDFLDFLSAISKDDLQNKPLLPFYLRQAITQSSLVLLGYRLRDWDFRVMFRGLINPTATALRPFSLAIQFVPGDSRVDAKKVSEYLEKYFGASNFTVEWDTPQGFMARLWEEWERWRR